VLAVPSHNAALDLSRSARGCHRPAPVFSQYFCWR